MSEERRARQETDRPVLVTCASSALGTALSRWLARHGRPVVALDVAPSAQEPEPAIERAHADPCDAHRIDELVSRCGLVFQLASGGLEPPARMLDVNVLGARNVLTSCLAHGRSVVLVSASLDAADAEGPHAAYVAAARTVEHYARALG